MPEHTPGPWTVGREEQELKGDPDDPWVVYGIGLYIDPDTSNGEADARLIAAAPDLLAALEEAFPTDTSGAMFIDEEVVKRARAAIAKALGSPDPASLPVTEKG